MRRHSIKLNIKTDKELLELQHCNKCSQLVPYGKLYFYIDESNIAITNNSKGVCKKCK